MAGENSARSLNAETSSLSKQKPVITLNSFGLPVGEHSTQLASRCGEIIRTVVPISIKDWRSVPKNLKDELWKLVSDDYAVPQSYKAKCVKSTCDMMRKYKTKLRSKYLDAHVTPDHTTGRYGYMRLEEKMKCQKKEGDPPPTRAEKWIEAHTRKDGTVPSSGSSHTICMHSGSKSSALFPPRTTSRLQFPTQQRVISLQTRKSGRAN